MSKAFAFDPDKLEKFINGDLGIADAINKAMVVPISDKTQTKSDKKTFDTNTIPDKNSGLWGVEKTFISTSLESQKPFIELVKVCLELFGHIEYAKTLLTGGANPYNDPNSFINSYKQNKDKQKKFNTGIKTDDVKEKIKPVLPKNIFLGLFERNTQFGNVSSRNPSSYLSGRQYYKYSTDYTWPQYESREEYISDQRRELDIKIKDLDQETKDFIILNRENTLQDEWGSLVSEAWLGGQNTDKIVPAFSVTSTIPPNIKKYYKPTIINYLNNDVLVDIEQDYNVEVVKQVDNDPYTETIVILATLKEDVINPSGKIKPEFLRSSLYNSVKYFFSKVLDVIITKFIPVFSELKKIMKSPVEFIADILMKKLKEHFKMFDTSLKDKEKFDKERLKYWTLDGKFVLDGKTNMDAGIFKLIIDIKNAIPSFKIGNEELPQDNKENPIIKQVSNMVALPINFLKGIFEIFTNLFNSMFKVKELPQTYSDFISLKAFKDLLSKDKLFEFLGAKNGDITTIPMLKIPKEGNIQLVPQMISAFLKMIIQFINGFITMPNTILNVDLVPGLPVPN